MSVIIDAVINSSKEPEVTKGAISGFDVRVFNPSTADLLLGLEPEDVIEYFGVEKILAALDEDDVIVHCNLPTRIEYAALEEEIEELKAEIEKLKNTTDAEYEEVVASKNYIEYKQI